MFKNSPKLKAYSRDDLVLTLICDKDFVDKTGPAAQTAIFTVKSRVFITTLWIESDYYYNY